MSAVAAPVVAAPRGASPRCRASRTTTRPNHCRGRDGKRAGRQLAEQGGRAGSGDRAGPLYVVLVRPDGTRWPGGRFTGGQRRDAGRGRVLERREKYRVAARGLIGGGWAALYSTTYASHAIEAARIITDPAVGTLLLAAVAAGMILHSFRYRSQVVTGLAYFVAFVTLAISPLNAFAVIALMPLAASLLYLAHRFRWTAMALLGLPATYGIYILHAAWSTGGTLATGQAILLRLLADF